MIACTIFDANIIDICSASQIFRLDDKDLLKSGHIQQATLLLS
ncbi:MAG: hypothetical protein V7K54_22885 [Nostoc sp.]